ncbi:MAG: hypothetical protein AAGU21_16165 [Solidesulfovibrio sp.]|uniref:hypothetical protein n=1 Tax=Solidesulfovibrio sp. TaxID=2910990 RepID=UPI0031581272
MNALEKMVQAAREVLAAAGDDTTSRPGIGFGRGQGMGMGMGTGMGRGGRCGRGGQGRGLRARDGSCRAGNGPTSGAGPANAS